MNESITLMYLFLFEIIIFELFYLYFLIILRVIIVSYLKN